MSVTMFNGLPQSTLTTKVTPWLGSYGGPCGAMLSTVMFAAPMKRCSEVTGRGDLIFRRRDEHDRVIVDRIPVVIQGHPTLERSPELPHRLWHGSSPIGLGRPPGQYSRDGAHARRSRRIRA